MQVEDGEDGASAGRGEGGADAPAARARPSEHAAAPARPATADAIKEMMLALERGHQARGGVPGGGSTDDVAGSGSEGTIVFCVWPGSDSEESTFRSLYRHSSCIST